MKRDNRLLRLFIWIVLLYAPLGMPLMAEAGAIGDDLQVSYNNFWIDYASFMKKVKAEGDNHKAAQLVEQMKKDMLPRLGQLIKNTGEWKKSHSQAEIKKMEDWVNSNPHATEVSSLQSELMVMASKEGGAFGKAFGEYMHAMTMLNKSK
jgi:hypothetical protein